VPRDPAEVAGRLGLSREAMEAILVRARRKLFEVRERRVHPHKDDKVLADWNGLMISGFAKASQVLEEPRYLQAAKNAAGFHQRRLYDSNKNRLFRRWREGERKAAGLAEGEDFTIVNAEGDAATQQSQAEQAIADGASVIARRTGRTGRAEASARSARASTRASTTFIS
jgi:uncharacterized protein YyaL (SSP411 family)